MLSSWAQFLFCQKCLEPTSPGLHPSPRMLVHTWFAIPVVGRAPSLCSGEEKHTLSPVTAVKERGTQAKSYRMTSHGAGVAKGKDEWCNRTRAVSPLRSRTRSPIQSRGGHQAAPNRGTAVWTPASISSPSHRGHQNEASLRGVTAQRSPETGQVIVSCPGCMDLE